MVKLAETTDCTGCLACADICPKSAIEVVKHDDGFDFPFINDSICVKCGRCIQVCPVNSQPDVILEPKKIYAMRTLDRQLLKNSSSGGIFGTIAKQVLMIGGIVFGCLVDENLHIKHSYITDIKDLPKLFGSKYVQSDTYGVFKLVKAFLNEGKTVLFSGTPCHVHALNNYVGKAHDKLITIDFICHGVPSPLLWNKYIEEFEKTGKTKVLDASFRDKTYGWKTFSLKLIKEDGSQYINPIPKDKYLHTFISDIAMRTCCTNCIAKNKGYSSDITLGDFWGADIYLPSVYDKMGVSIVLANTESGMKYINDIVKECVCEKIPLDIVDKVSPSRLHSSKKNIYRDYFIKDLNKRGFAFAYNRWLKNSIISKVRRKIVSMREVHGK